MQKTYFSIPSSTLTMDAQTVMKVHPLKELFDMMHEGGSLIMPLLKTENKLTAKQIAAVQAYKEALVRFMNIPGIAKRRYLKFVAADALLVLIKELESRDYV